MTSQRNNRVPRRGLSQSIILTILLPLLAQGATNLLETPQTVQPASVSAGLGLTGLLRMEFQDVMPQASFAFVTVPEIWVRTGITHRFDVGIALEPDYLEAGCKYGIIEDYLSAGVDLGLGLGDMARGNFVGQASLLGGIPGKVVSPYGIIRYRYLYRSQIWPDDDTVPSVHTVMAAAGLRIKPVAWLSLYAEAGAYYGRFPEHSEDSSAAGLVVGAGVTFDFSIKRR